MASSFSRLHDLLRRKYTFGRTPLDEWSARRTDHYPTTHNTHKGQTPMYPGGIQTRNHSKRVAADPRLRPRRHWHRHLPYNWQWIFADLTAYLRNNSSCGYFIRENMRLTWREIWRLFKKTSRSFWHIRLLSTNFNYLIFSNLIRTRI